ncbi:alpha/beta hydrolase [Olsenella uli]
MSTLSGDLYSKSLRITQHVNVIIPDESEDFWTKIDDEVRVLYLLHGLGSNSNEWTRFSMIEAYAKIYGFAVIMPDGNRSFYENVTYGPHYLDWISQELPGLIHTWFRLPSDRNHTFIAGESMGGFGALRIALENPDRYGGVVALSPVTDPLALVNDFSSLFFGSDEWRAVFGPSGPLEDDSIASTARMSVLSHGAGAIPRIIQMVGTDDPFCPYVEEVARELTRLGIQNSFSSWPGRHDFLFWNTAIERAIRMLCGMEGSGC